MKLEVIFVNMLKIAYFHSICIFISIRVNSLLIFFHLVFNNTSVKEPFTAETWTIKTESLLYLKRKDVIKTHFQFLSNLLPLQNMIHSSNELHEKNENATKEA